MIKTSAESNKALVEAGKIKRETLWHPMLIAASVLAATITVTKLFL